jgi:internalin A
MTAAPDDPLLIYETKKTPDWPRWGEAVTTIHLGSQDGEAVAITLPEDLAERFPALTCLRLWNLQLTGLPALPASLRELEVRRCAQLQGLRNLPAGLEVLVLEDLPGITELPGEAKFPSLWDLGLGGSTGIRAEGINEFLRRCSAVRWLDLARCTQMEEIEHWPPPTERIVLNGCGRLQRLPPEWPAELQRLDLANVGAIRRLPEFGVWPDYLDLSGTENLSELDRPEGVRTLLLQGSGILVPPATEHGSQRGENVAQRTESYYEDTDEFGKGHVKRCKLLLLGNGSAGKTSLALAVRGIPEPAMRAKDLGSTHGVQFFDLDKTILINGQNSRVKIHIWDFGGQEIYHQTHRLFMSKGAVFMVLWNPKQDNGTPSVTDAGYLDIWRPLRYWLDFIHLACPWKPRILVVRSHSRKISAEDRRKFAAQISGAHENVELIAVDTLAKTDLGPLQEWLDRNVREVVETQGTAVPSYWQIAQDMVGRWLPTLNPEAPHIPRAAEFDDMSPDEFGEKLMAEVRRLVAIPGSHVDSKLRRAVSKGRFNLQENDRLRRTLEFLTNSGWLYWNDKLFEERVIIGQHWALDGIYAVLDRSPKSRVYEELEKSKGQFTRRDLDEWVWGRGDGKKGHSVETQNLLLSFMEQAGVCFRLVSEQDSYWQEAVYKAFMHLPFEEELNLISEFMERHPTSGYLDRSISRSLLHQGHWNEWLRTMGTIYGTDGKYAQNGFALRTGEGQDVCVTMDFTRDENGKPAGLGGTITVRVAGERAGDLLKALVAHIESFLPTEGVTNASAHSGRSDGSPRPAGEPPNRVRLFVSYTWNPEGTDHAGNGYIDEPVATDYEAPVNAIEEALMPYAHIVKFVRDSKEIKAGQLITEFMKQIKSSEKVLIVYGDKYWRSPYCVYELTEGLRSKGLEERRFTNVFRFVSVNGMKLGVDSQLGVIRKFWREYKAGSFPILMKKVATARGLKAAVADLVENSLPVILDFSDLHQEWNPKKPDGTIQWVKDFLGIKP